MYYCDLITSRIFRLVLPLLVVFMVPAGAVAENHIQLPSLSATTPSGTTGVTLDLTDLTQIAPQLQLKPSRTISAFDALQGNFDWGQFGAIDFGNFLQTLTLRDSGAAEALRGLQVRTPTLQLKDDVFEVLQSDFSGALELLENAARGGDPVAAMLAGTARRDQVTTSQEFDRVVDFFLTAGSAEVVELKQPALLGLAQTYQYGPEGRRDLDQAQFYYEQAAELDTAAIPELLSFYTGAKNVDIFSNDEALKWLDAASADGNPSAMGQQYHFANLEVREDIVARLRQSEFAIAGRYLGDIELERGNVIDAFEAYQISAGVDPYSRGQVGIIALQEPDLIGLGVDQSRRLINDAASLGAPNAIVYQAREALEVGDTETAYLQSMYARENDTSNFYQDELRSLMTQACAEDQEDCSPTPIWYVTNLPLDSDTGRYRNTLGDSLSTGVATALVKNVVDGDYERRTLARNILCGGFKGICSVDETITVTEPKLEPDGREVADFVASLKDEAEEAGITKAVIFIHGFNNSFDEAAVRLALLTNRADFRAVPIMFSWASGARALVVNAPNAPLTWAYEHDRSIAVRSCPVFRQVLGVAASTFGAENVQVLAHSMGTYLYSMMMEGCGNGAATPPVRLKSVVYAAADIDEALFEQSYAQFRPTAEFFTHYTTANDIALQVSANYMNPDTKRLGQGGTQIFSRQDAAAIDTSPLESDPNTNSKHHGHVFDVPLARLDLGRLLSGDYLPTSRHCLQRITADKEAYRLRWNAC